MKGEVMNIDVENKRKRILGYIRAFTTANQYPPSVQEIADAIGFPKPTIIYHIKKLETDGYLEKRPVVYNRAMNRFLKLTRKGKAYLND
jgi:DNA-binding MarR family transcriptional regulator